MKIDVFNPISFCFGVENSINMIKKAAIEYKGRPIFCMGQPIHNELVTSELENLGITIISTALDKYSDEIKKMPNDCVIIFSAHGHDTKLNEICAGKNMIVVDSICPIVATIRQQILNCLNKNEEIIYIGKKDHPESYAIQKISHLVNFWDISSSFLVDFNLKSPNIFNQTTILQDKILPIYDKIIRNSPAAIIKNTSCKYVNSRYEQLKNISSDSYDYIIIAGSNTSSNTLELYEKGVELFGDKTLLISKADQLKDLVDLNNKSLKFALFSGTSAPQELIDAIKKILMQ